MARRRAAAAEGKRRGLEDNQAAEGPETAPGGRSPDTAEGEPPPEDPSGRDPQTLFWDPFAIVEQLGFRDRPSAVTYQTLKSIVWRTPIIRAIIQTRLNQVAAFCQPQRDRFHLGFRVRTRDEAHEPTKEDRKWIQQAESLIMRTGVTENPRGRDNFETFARKTLLDSMTLDQMCFETVPDRKGRPCEWYAVDGSTIRLADSASTYLHVDLEDDVRYVQIYDGMIINEYTLRDLAFCVRNPSTDIRLFGYGTSELEMLVEAITSFLYAWEYNTRFFRQGSAMKGLINLKGTVPDDKLRAFRRHWYTMVSGVENAWRTPILNAEDVQWLPMQTSNRDMEFGAWMDFLIKVCCFPPGTLVATSAGPMPIEDVRPGDSVRTHMGRLRPVENCQRRHFSGELVGLRTFGTDRIRCTPEHPFLVVDSEPNAWMGVDISEPHWVEAKDLVAQRHLLAVPKPQVQGPFTQVLRLADHLEAGTFRKVKGGGLRSLGGRSNTVCEEIPLTESTAFALGLFAAEGNASERSNFSWSFHEKETDLQSAAMTFVKRTLRLPCSISRQPESHATSVRGSSVLVSRALRSAFGPFCTYRKVPEEILTSSLEVQRAFLSGVIAGDGCCRSRGTAPSATVGSASRRFLEQLRGMLLLQGVWSSLYGHDVPPSMRNHAGKMWGLRIEGEFCGVLAGWLTGEKGDLLRKAVQGSSGVRHRRVRSTEAYFYVPVTEVWAEQYDGGVYNLEVSEDHSYVVGSYAVHNCSLYSIDPVEVNFQYGNQGQKSALNQQSNREKITESKERGLRPLLRFFAGAINRYIIWPWNESFEFEFTGLDAMTRDEWADYNKKRVSTTITIDEIRAEEDRPPLPDGMGKVILDPGWLQMLQQKQQQAQQEQMQAQQAAMGGQQQPGMPPGQDQGQGQPPEQQAQGGEQDVFDEDQLAQQLGGAGQGFTKSRLDSGTVVIDISM